MEFSAEKRSLLSPIFDCLTNRMGRPGIGWYTLGKKVLSWGLSGPSLQRNPLFELPVLLGKITPVN